MMRDALITLGTMAAFYVAQAGLSAIFSTVPPGWVASILLCGSLLGVAAMFARFYWDRKP